MRGVFTVLLSCCLGALNPLLRAQAPVVLAGAEGNPWHHRIGPIEAMHVDPEKIGMTPFQMFGANVELEVVVSANGRVNEAHAIGGPPALYERAVQIELGRSFKPFTHDGLPVVAKIRDAVIVAPLEVWLPNPPAFPAEVDLSTFLMSLSRSRCYGSCPDYKVSVSGSGTIVFDGGSNVLVPGHHTAQIAPAAARDLFLAFRKADFLAAQDRYVTSVTDMPTSSISLSYRGGTKKVVDYDGIEAGMPDAVRDLERRIDETAHTERWLTSNAGTLPSLKAEHWDFSSKESDNMALYRSAILHDDKDLVDALIAARAPIDISGTEVSDAAPVCVASETGNLTLVERMTSGRKPVNKAVWQPCLAAAARGGNVDIVDLWIDHGAKPGAPPSGGTAPGESILADGIASGNSAVVQRLLDYPVDLHQKVHDDLPLVSWALSSRGDNAGRAEILELLVKAGASVNERDSQGRTPLFEVNFHPEVIKPLIALGAEVNVRDNRGDTPLINAAFVPEAVREFLSAGADPTLANHDGETALLHARQFGCPECAGMIAAAIKHRAQTQSH